MDGWRARAGLGLATMILNDPVLNFLNFVIGIASARTYYSVVTQVAKRSGIWLAVAQLLGLLCYFGTAGFSFLVMGMIERVALVPFIAGSTTFALLALSKASETARRP
jgi:hypothetical protein